MMARLLSTLLAASMATGLALPAVARDQQPAAPQVNPQPGYPGAYAGGWQGQYPVAPMVYGTPVYVQPVYSYPVYSAPVYNGQPQGYVPAAPQGYVAAPPQGYVPAPQPGPDADPRYREMVEKCQGVGHRGSGTTGAVIGGLVGGVAGNRIASGNRVVGTVAGAAVGAVAGGAIGKSIDKNREQECDQFFSSYTPPQSAAYGYVPPASGGYAYPAGAPAYGYAPVTGAPMGYIMMPAGSQQANLQAQGNCTETRTVSYEYVPVKRRYIGAPPRRVLRDKRVKVPEGS